ncbi:tripartite tricarboxylate transporter TctB family protein [Curvibacter sp. RS43]|jgi:putative tricarboxylic transport membrane protein|uniref:Tripartite tricarboxylate transporter TctB family protein n=1 Tax=Curvibacter microcysteis TaxID=3026419 RepID=A0ABT5MDY5_9BURK|nr:MULTISPECIES: tripartite tricarboxylate transporter TctB family protein [unclassified Curvibacter]MDD0809621.1 tripartite tricarboxylate transporter TctB family protein [Curvibacter sp. RS43]MDD0814797.1 tripartite tricarboxylate transporter TctB family protein [Curvibacter sp. HBC28]
MSSHSSSSPRLQTAVGLAVLLLACLLAWGATGISSDAGYAGVGPNFLPWVVSAALGLCGVGLLVHSLSGGFRQLEEASGAERGHWAGFAWVSAALLLNAWLITTLGFVLSCTLCFVLAVRGFRSAEGRLNLSLRALLQDAGIGLLIAAPVYWMFTKLLAINLPGLTGTGWL